MESPVIQQRCPRAPNFISHLKFRSAKVLIYIATVDDIQRAQHVPAPYSFKVLYNRSPFIKR